MDTNRYIKRLSLATLTNAPIGVGAFIEGNVLLIGEQASNPSEAPEQQPFCTNKGCSGWLNKQLDSEQIPEERLFWINALNNDSSLVDLKQLVTQLKPIVVIALGEVAKQTCKQQGIEHEAFYHPQYWKRFRSKERYALLDKLSELTVKNVQSSEFELL
jgi:hypothetical protein